MTRTPEIKEFVTRYPQIIFAAESIHRAKQLMYEHSIRHLPVIDNNEVAGIITDRDIKLAQAVNRESDFEEKYSVKDIAVYDAYIVQGDTPANEVLEHMVRCRIGSALVLDGKNLLGIFTSTDACREFARLLRERQAASGSVSS
jgi:acetoin utilization protein AcuB